MCVYSAVTAPIFHLPVLAYRTRPLLCRYGERAPNLELEAVLVGLRHSSRGFAESEARYEAVYYRILQQVRITFMFLLQ